MDIWNWTILGAVALVTAGALYVHFRWRRSPQAHRAMVALAGCYFVAGAITGSWILYLTRSNPVRLQPLAKSTLATAPTPAVLASALPMLHYDPVHAILPDPKLTPGDALSGVTADDVCTPGWATEHRHVTESERARILDEYGVREGWQNGRFVSYEVDHLIPLELGGSNDIKNLWPQPDDPRPASAEKDRLENELHGQLCSGRMTLADAQHCITSNWVQCWEKYVVPGYGEQWASEYRHGW